jgi:hypothetical protein
MRILIGNNEVEFPTQVEELILMKATICNDIANIKNQIAKKELDGDISKEWLYKAQSSIRYKKVMRKVIKDLITNEIFE